MYPAWRHRVLRVSADVRCVMLPLLLVAIPSPGAVGIGLALAGAGGVWVELLTMMRVQEDVPAALRARVFGLVDMLLVTGAALGTMLAAGATTTGPVAALVLSGLGLAVLSLLGSPIRSR